MIKALKVRKTGELFRVVVSGPSFGWVPTEGGPVPCLNALLHKSRGKAGRKEYDKQIMVTFFNSVYAFCEVSNDAVEAHEKRRASELMCRRFHKEKCEPVAYEKHNAAPVISVAEDGNYWFKKSLKLLLDLEEYLEGRRQMEPTRLAVLRFDLKNFNSWAKKHEGEMDGSSRAET